MDPKFIEEAENKGREEAAKSFRIAFEREEAPPRHVPAGSQESNIRPCRGSA
jgi:hypothetical protein